jgi:hypothetical protein
MRLVKLKELREQPMGTVFFKVRPEGDRGPFIFVGPIDELDFRYDPIQYKDGEAIELNNTLYGDSSEYNLNDEFMICDIDDHKALICNLVDA